MLLQNGLIIAAVAVPAVLLVLWRTNAALVFLSLCAGALLVEFVGHEADLVSVVMANNNDLVTQYSRLILMLIPVVLTIVIFRKTVPQSKLLFNGMAAVAAGLTGVLLVVPLLPFAAREAVMSTQGWATLSASRELVVAGSVLASLVALIIMQPRHKEKKKH